MDKTVEVNVNMDTSDFDEFKEQLDQMEKQLDRIREKAQEIQYLFNKLGSNFQDNGPRGWPE